MKKPALDSCNALFKPNRNIHSVFMLRIFGEDKHTLHDVLIMYSPFASLFGKKETCTDNISQQSAKLMACTSLVWPTGVSKCGSHMYTVPCV